LLHQTILDAGGVVKGELAPPKKAAAATIGRPTTV
jgi:hypothetical protein